MAERRTGKQAVLDHFEQEGVRHVFGNPGTTELPLVEALSEHAGIDYVLCPWGRAPRAVTGGRLAGVGDAAGWRSPQGRSGHAGARHRGAHGAGS